SQRMTAGTLVRPGSIAVRRQLSGSLQLVIEDRSYADVTVARAAPLSAPDRYIVFFADREIAMLADLAQADPVSRAVLVEELRRRDLTALIHRIDRSRQEADVSYVSALTDRGPREFVIRSTDENTRWFGERHVLLLDIDGNRFNIPDVEALDRRSARLLYQTL